MAAHARRLLLLTLMALGLALAPRAALNAKAISLALADSVYLPLVMRNAGSPTLDGCLVLPVDNIWNTPVDNLPVHANSAAFVNAIGAAAHFHTAFGSGTWQGFPIGIPFNLVSGSQPQTSVTFVYAGESDPGPYPIPANPLIEGDPNGSGDRHMLILDRDKCVLYEMWHAQRQQANWYAGAGAIFDLNSNALRPAGWTSADEAGLPILPGLARYDEVAEGAIKHALRFSSDTISQAYVWPARHYAPFNGQAGPPPLGQRFRLKASFNVSQFSPQAQVVARALQKYGLILADKGVSWHAMGAPDARWNNVVLNELEVILGSDFEAVDVSSLMVDPNSGQARR